MGGPGVNTFGKEERLCGRSNISRLISSGKWGGTAHLHYCWTFSGEEGPNRLLVSVSRKRFKRAVKRNLVKRRLREAFRKQKELLGTTGVDFMLSYSSDELAAWATIKEEVATVLERIGKAAGKERATREETLRQEDAA